MHLLDRHVLDQAIRDETRIVDEHVNLEAKSLDCLKHSLRRIRICKILDQNMHLHSIRSLQLIRKGAYSALFEIKQNKYVAVSGQTPSESGPDACC